MTELLHREKEFREINERLNKMAQPQSNSNSNTPTSPRTNKNVTKFTARAADASRTAATGRLNGGTTLNGTYTKLKGPTHLLKKQQGGAGDGTVDTIPTIPPLHPPTRKPTDTYTKVAKTNGGDKRESKFGNALRKNVRDSPRGGANNDGAGNGADNRDSNTTTRRNNNAANSQNRTFVMRYRNPNFVESPSLEMIVRDELSSLEMERLSTEFQQSSSREQQADQQASNISMQLDAMTNGIKRSEYKIAAGDRRKFSTDGLIKFLKSKVTILEEQHGSLSREMTKQKEVLDKALERTKVLEQQRDQAYAKNNSLSEQLHKVETQLEEANTRVKERVQTQLQQQKDIEELKRELKMVTQSNANLEKRLFRAQEELENSKTTITSMKNAEREFKESVRVEAENKEKQLKNLKKLRGDLFNAYKKQLYLIDNLSRQNICLEQAAMVGITEKEFNKVLDWNGGAENATDPKSSPNH